MGEESLAGGGARCDLCGGDYSIDDPASIGLEVVRSRPDAGFSDYLNAGFCSQAHASEWLGRPLPAPEPTVPYEPSARDRLVDVAIVAAIATTAAFAAIGIGAVIWWIWTR